MAKNSVGEGFYTNVARYGNKILYRGVDRDGVRVDRKLPFGPTLYVPDRGENGNKPEFHSLDGTPLAPVKFEKMSEAKEFIDMYKDVSNFKVYGNTKYVSQFIYEKFPSNVKFDINCINIMAIDIEVASDEGFPFPNEAKHEIISICVINNQSEVRHVWGLGEYDVSLYDGAGRVSYIQCENERKLITHFMSWYSEFANTPDVITGWNSTLFDIPYMINRIHRLFGEDAIKKFSPWGMVNYRPFRMNGREQDAYEIVGVSQMDYLDLFKKFGYSYGTQESYKLDHIANVVLGDRKLSYEEYGNLHTLYKENHQLFIDYNIKDTDLIWRLDDKMGLIALAMTIAYKAGVNYADTFGTTSIWETIIYRELASKNIVVPPREDKFKSEYPGGYVKDVVTGLHDYVCSFDLNSLYPNLIIQYNMSPETITGDITPGVTPDSILNGTATNDIEGTSMAANGVHFSNEKQGIIPKIIDELYQERVQVKKGMLAAQQRKEGINKKDRKALYEVEKEIATLENTQMAIKILLNSLYGAMGNKYFVYFDLRIAEAITLSGQLSIRWAERAVNNFMNKALKTDGKDYVIAIDTDSLYVAMNDVIKSVKPTDPIKFLDKMCSGSIEPILDKAYANLSATLNCFDNRMKMKREAIADRGIWIAKKRYILHVHNNEGVQYAEPKLKIMGIEAIKSSTPAVCRGAMKSIFKTIVTTDEKTTQKEIAKFKKEWYTLPAESVSFPRGISDIEKYADRQSIYKKGAQAHIRAALQYNHLLNTSGLSNRYELINSGDKIKYTNLKMPNPIKSDVIGFVGVLPKEFQIHKYVDYDTQFQKAFLDPLNMILNAIGWSAEEVASLDDFFS